MYLKVYIKDVGKELAYALGYYSRKDFDYVIRLKVPAGVLDHVLIFNSAITLVVLEKLFPDMEVKVHTAKSKKVEIRKARKIYDLEYSEFIDKINMLNREFYNNRISSNWTCKMNMTKLVYYSTDELYTELHSYYVHDLCNESEYSLHLKKVEMLLSLS